MQIQVEVDSEGQRERRHVATIQRSADLAAVDGLGLTLAEPKDLLERLQATVVREHADALVDALRSGQNREQVVRYCCEMDSFAHCAVNPFGLASRKSVVLVTLQHLVAWVPAFFALDFCRAPRHAPIAKKCADTTPARRPPPKCP